MYPCTLVILYLSFLKSKISERELRTFRTAFFYVREFLEPRNYLYHLLAAHGILTDVNLPRVHIHLPVCCVNHPGLRPKNASTYGRDTGFVRIAARRRTYRMI